MDLNQVTYQVQTRNTMHDFIAKNPNLPNPFRLLNYETFELTSDMLTQSKFSLNTTTAFHTHPWITPPEFSYSCFDIKSQKVKDLMGSLTQIQKQQSNPFDINVKVKGMEEFTPFASFLQKRERVDVSYQLDSFMNPLEIAGVEGSGGFEKSSIENKESEQYSSIFSDVDFYRLMELPEYHQGEMHWDTNPHQLLTNNPLIYSPHQKIKTESINQIQSYYFEVKPLLITQQQLIIHLILALQMIENKMFELDYQNMVWSIRPEINFNIDFYVNGSVREYIKEILAMCNMRSKLDVVMEYIVIREGKKEIYSKLIQVYNNSLRIFESILMSYLENPLTFLEFYLSLQPIKKQLNLLLTLLLKQQYLNHQPFCDFRKEFLSPETSVYKHLLEKLRLIDNCQQDQKHLIRSLGLSCFSTILYSLNVFLNSNLEEWERSNHQQFYFGLLFEERKEDVDKIIEKLNEINQDDLEIYGICRENMNIKITLDYVELCAYERGWKRLFERKRRQVKKIAKRLERDRMSKLQEVIQQKAREIQEMKRELNEKLALSYKVKAENREKQKMLIEIYKNQIQKKIEAKKLLKLIEIQEEKGYLLDKELKERDMLLSKKYEMLADHPELIKRRMGEIENDIRLDNSGKKVILQVSSTPRSQADLPHPSIQQFPSHNIPPTIPLHPVSKQKLYPPYHKSNSYQQNTRIVRRPSIRSLTASVEENMSFQDDRSERSESDHENENEDNDFEMLKGVEIEVPINVALDVCVYDILRNQVDVLNYAYQTILYSKYRLSEIFSFLHKHILTANGQHATDLLNQSVDSHSFFNISYLKDYFFSQNIKDEIRSLSPIFYRSDCSPMIGTLNLIQPTSQKSLQVAIGLKFHNLPQILKPIFNYIQMTRYMEIFAFSLRIRHCVHLIELQWKTLQTFERMKSKRKQKIDTKLLKRLFDIRYKIQCFFNLFQNYFFLYVVQKQYKLLEEEFIRKQEIDNLPNIHNKFLEKIILRGFVQTQHEMAGRFKKTFVLVKEFHNIVGLFCGEDIDGYAKPDVDERLRRIEREFVELYKVLQNTIG